MHVGTTLADVQHFRDEAVLSHRPCYLVRGRPLVMRVLQSLQLVEAKASTLIFIGATEWRMPSIPSCSKSKPLGMHDMVVPKAMIGLSRLRGFLMTLAPPLSRVLMSLFGTTSVLLLDRPTRINDKTMHVDYRSFSQSTATHSQ